MSIYRMSGTIYQDGEAVELLDCPICGCQPTRHAHTNGYGWLHYYQCCSLKTSPLYGEGILAEVDRICDWNSLAESKADEIAERREKQTAIAGLLTLARIAEKMYPDNPDLAEKFISRANALVEQV